MLSPENVSVGGVSVMPANWNGPNARRTNAAATGPSASAFATSCASTSGGTSPISFAHASDATITAPDTSSLPKQWSPFACVFTSVSMRAADGTAARIAASISAVSGRSKSVSTSIVASPSTTSPALLQPHDPSGWSHAKQPVPRSCSPRV
jgi:hypothetical protein